MRGMYLNQFLLSKLSLLILLSFSYESFNWDSLFTNPTFDFYFKVVLPKKQKEREIIERDYLGRIIKARVPEVTGSYV